MLTYASALSYARKLGAALLARKLSAARPLAIISDNDIEHGLLALAALYVGVPFVAISLAYSLLSRDHKKLQYALKLMTPGLVFASDGARFAEAIAASVLGLDRRAQGSDPHAANDDQQPADDHAEPAVSGRRASSATVGETSRKG